MTAVTYQFILTRRPAGYKFGFLSFLPCLRLVAGTYSTSPACGRSGRSRKCCQPDSSPWPYGHKVAGTARDDRGCLRSLEASPAPALENKHKASQGTPTSRADDSANRSNTTGGRGREGNKGNKQSKPGQANSIKLAGKPSITITSQWLSLSERASRGRATIDNWLKPQNETHRVARMQPSLARMPHAPGFLLPHPSLDSPTAVADSGTVSRSSRPHQSHR